MPKKALLVLADGFEEIEAFAPFDILKRAGIDVTLAGVPRKEVKSARGAKVLTDKILDEKDELYDAVIFPGGLAGAENLAKSEKVKSLIKKMHEKGKIIAAICASPAVVLAPLGVLDGKEATCYPGMEKKFTSKIHFTQSPVVLDGNMLTSRAPGTAHLLGFKLAELLAGREKAESVKKATLF